MKMRKAPSLAIVMALLSGGVAVLPRHQNRSAAERASSRPAEMLRQVADEVWQRRLGSPALRLEQGLPVVELPRLSPAMAEEEATFARSTLAKLETINEADLSHEDALTLALLRWDASQAAEAAKFHWLTSPVTPYNSTLARTVHPLFTSFGFGQAADLDRYLDLLADYTRLIEEMHNHLRRQAARGIVLPKDEIDLVMALLKGFAQEPGKSLFMVDDVRLRSIEAQPASRFKQQLATEIRARTNPALVALMAYLAGPYREQAPDQVGLWQYPGGTDYYQYLVKHHTTMETTPEEVHQVGLKEVERLEREMAEVREKLGFRGAKAEFHKFLKTDTRFFPKTPDEIRAKLLKHANDINPKLDRLFLTRPRAPFDTQRLAPSLEGVMTFGYYQRPTPNNPTGVYYFNGSKLEERSLLQSESLIYHELVPGHHFHVASQSENDRLPPVRKNYYSTAFTEGWGMYASTLGRELGQYRDLYDLYGYLSMQIMVATRLVVDTGMNHLRWPRERAMEFMREHTLLSETEINTESLRYSVDLPGQALAYKMGEIKLHELRERARKNLGDKFDVRKFHQVVLGSGALPMAVLEQHVDWFIAEERR